MGMIIGITGSFGAGKGSVADYLVHEKGFAHFSARAFIVEEIKKRGLLVDRDSMIAVANDLRKSKSPTYILEELIKQAKASNKDAVIESLRAVAEARYVKNQGGIVLGIDADPQLRYKRSVQRRSETDNVSFEKWREQEINESNPDDPTKQDIFGALKESDYIINNDVSLEELHARIDAFLKTVPGQ